MENSFYIDAVDKKVPSYKFWDSHRNDKMALRPSYLHNGNI